MKIVTNGRTGLDIDGYAGCVAYAEFLRAKGFEALAVSTATFNGSITEAAKSWSVQLATSYEPAADDSFILVDISSPDQLDKIVDLQRVEKVIDHRPGYEDYWRNQSKAQVVIERVGAACTLVYEAWQKEELIAHLSLEAAKLMTYAILDNTLNFQAAISSQRDKEAYQQLSQIASLPNNWAEQYFVDCSQTLVAHFLKVLEGDLQFVNFKTLHKTLLVGQAVIWDDFALSRKQYGQARKMMSEKSEEWFVNFINLKDGRNQILTSSSLVANWLIELLGASWMPTKGIIKTERLWLRKEILSEDIKAFQTSN